MQSFRDHETTMESRFQNDLPFVAVHRKLHFNPMLMLRYIE